MMMWEGDQFGRSNGFQEESHGRFGRGQEVGARLERKEEHRQGGAGVLAPYGERRGVDFGGDQEGSKSSRGGSRKPDPGYQGHWEDRFSRRDCVSGKQGDR